MRADILAAPSLVRLSPLPPLLFLSFHASAVRAVVVTVDGTHAQRAAFFFDVCPLFVRLSVSCAPHPSRPASPSSPRTCGRDAQAHACPRASRCLRESALRTPFRTPQLVSATTPRPAPPKRAGVGAFYTQVERWAVRHGCDCGGVRGVRGVRQRVYWQQPCPANKLNVAQAWALTHTHWQSARFGSPRGCDGADWCGRGRQ